MNDAGATLALINWYSVGACVSGQSVSRGEVVKFAVAIDSHGLTDAALAELPLARVNPVRLIGVFPGHKTVWNALRPALLKYDPVYRNDEAGFCAAYRRSEYAPSLREPWF